MKMMMVHLVLLAVVDDGEAYLETSLLQQLLMLLVSIVIFQILREKSEGFHQVETYHFDHEMGLLIVVLHFVQDPQQIDLYSQ